MYMYNMCMYIHIFVDHSCGKSPKPCGKVFKTFGPQDANCQPIRPIRPLLGWCIQRHGQTAEATSAQKEVRVAQGFHSSQVPEHMGTPLPYHP